MTFYHFVNCLALTFGPAFAVWKGTKLGEYKEYAGFFWSALFYTINQAVQLMLVATFAGANTEDEDGVEIVNYRADIVRALIGLITFYALKKALMRLKSGDRTVRLLTLGFAWALSESIYERVLPFYVHARSLEFSWSNLESAIAANISLAFYMGLTTLIWLSTRRMFPRAKMMGQIALLVLFVWPLLAVWLPAELALLARLGVGLAIGALAMREYSVYDSLVGQKKRD